MPGFCEKCFVPKVLADFMQPQFDVAQENNDPGIKFGVYKVITGLGRVGTCTAEQPRVMDECGDDLVECGNENVPLMDEIADKLGFDYFTITGQQETD